MMKVNKFLTKYALILSCGCVIFFLSGLILTLTGSTIFDYFMKTQVILTPNSKAFQKWKEVAGPYTANFYFFNWTNPEEVQHDKSVKPKLKETGPYRFKITRENVNIIWNNNNGTMTIHHKNYWYVDVENDDYYKDMITTVNGVTLSVAYMVRFWSYFSRRTVSFGLGNFASNIYVTKPANQMLFDGFEDKLISIGKSLLGSSTSFPIRDKFGWFYGVNGSTYYEGSFNIGTGQNTTLGEVYNWNYWSRNPYYNGNCGKIDGLVGDFFKPNSNDTIHLFTPALCRTATLYFDGISTVRNIAGNKYTMKGETFDYGEMNPKNKCYCSGECIPPGVFNISDCRYGSPSFVSLPHFYNGDPYYTNLVDGLKPEKDKHEHFYTIEPTTGIPIEVKSRFQLIFLLQPVSGMTMFEDVPKVYFPILWFEHFYQIPELEAFLLRLFINLPIICLTTGILMMMVSLIFAFYLLQNRTASRRKRDAITDEHSIPLKSTNH